jgi:murein DD-endopeptidase MepM/ murein hydrolase activator NlpD
MTDPVNIDLGKYRKFGFKLGNNFHCGHDYNCPLWTEVKSIQDGVVCFVGQKSGFGGWKPSKKGGVVCIKHGNIIAIYGHVKYDRSLRTGQSVKEGQVIGLVSDYVSNGISLPHLHFCIYDGKSIPSTRWGYVPKLNDWIPPLLYLKGSYK